MVAISFQGPLIAFDAVQQHCTIYPTIVSRMMASLEACTQLYVAGELDQHLQPSRRFTSRSNSGSLQLEEEQDFVALSHKKLYVVQVTFVST